MSDVTPPVVPATGWSERLGIAVEVDRGRMRHVNGLRREIQRKRPVSSFALVLPQVLVDEGDRLARQQRPTRLES
jgi:hypothetical protein